MTAFPLEPIDPSQTQYWKALTGEPPTVSQMRPRDQTLTEYGPFLGGQFSVEVNPIRIIWRLAFDPGDTAKNIPSIGTFENSQHEFSALMQRWLGDCPPIKRLAFGAVLFCLTESQNAAFAKLNELLPSVEVDSENTRDFIYRINRRRQSQVIDEELDINRLTTWSVNQIAGVKIEVGDETGIHATRDSRYFSRLELDINSAQERNVELERTKLSELFAELIALGNEIAVSGEIP